MSVIASAGIPGRKVFDLARKVEAAPAKLFDAIHKLAENMRYSYPDACRMVGERVRSEDMRTLLLRLADALRSGEPLPSFLVREARVHGERYENEYERNLEALKKWNDGYTAVTVSVSLIIINNMVSTMIYDLGQVVMAAMAFGAIVIGFIVAWVLSRAAPQEVMSVPWAQGSKEQRLAFKLLKISLPIVLLVTLAMVLLKVSFGWIFVTLGVLLLPLGIASYRAESHVAKKDEEIGAFFRSLGGTATSRGTTLGQALESIEMASFPNLRPHIRKLLLRLRANAKPEVCWQLFGLETGSLLIDQAVDMFFDATSLGGDPEQSGLLSSMFTEKVAMLRAKRRGVAGTFSWLILAMHTVLSALIVFVLQILKKFMQLIQASGTMEYQEEAMRQLAVRMLTFTTPQTAFLEKMALALIVMMALTNAFAIVASEGTHIAKMSFYLAIMYFVSGISFLIVPSIVNAIL